MRRVLALGFGLSTAGLGAFNLLLARSPLDTSPLAPVERATLAVQTSAGSAESQTDQPAGHFGGAFVDRPLFHADRRPYAPPPEVAPLPPEEVDLPVAEQPQALPEPPPPPALPAVVLLGVSLAQGKDRALLRENEQSEAEWRRKEDVVSGWTVAEVRSDGVLLTSGTNRMFLPLYGRPSP